MNHTLSRRELYDLVWVRPMIKVAAEFGISDVGLNKICKRHRVPVPGRGYWAKLAAGKKVAKAPFRELADERLSQVAIQKSLTANVPPEAIEARIQAKSTIAARHPPKVDAGNTSQTMSIAIDSQNPHPHCR